MQTLSLKELKSNKVAIQTLQNYIRMPLQKISGKCPNILEIKQHTLKQLIGQRWNHGDIRKYFETDEKKNITHENSVLWKQCSQRNF